MCRQHTREYNRAWAKKNPEKNRAKGARFRKANPVGYRKLATRTYLRSKYGLSENDYALLFAQQLGRCAICATELVNGLDPFRPVKGHAPNEVARVDHCHETGRIRGLLCFSCNVGLGKFRDNETLLLKAARYLRENATVLSLSRPQHVTLQGETEPLSRDLVLSTSRGRRQQQLNSFLN